jgi:hypothetical protein
MYTSATTLLVRAVKFFVAFTASQIGSPASPPSAALTNPVLPISSSHSASAQLEVRSWVIRATATRLPTLRELRENTKRWTYLQGISLTPLPKTETELINSIQKRNPGFTIALVAPEVRRRIPWDKNLTIRFGRSVELKIVILGRDRKKDALLAIKRIHGKASHRLFSSGSADQLLISQDASVSHSVEEPPGAATYKGYRGIPPGTLVAVNPDISYRIETIKHNLSIPQDVVTRQIPGYIVLYSIRRLGHLTPLKGEP